MTDERDDIARYREGSMSPAERHALEKKALSDPFLADALEGSGSVSSEEFSADLQEFSKKLRNQQPKTWYIPLRIAAGVILLLGTGALFYFFNSSRPAPLALDKATASSTPADSAAGRRDSSSTLLTLAKPEESGGDARKSSSLSAASLAKTDETRLADEAKAGAGAIAEISKTETPLQPTAVARSEGEEKSKIKSTEISDAKEEDVERVPTLAAGPPGENKRTEQALRSAKSKSASSLDLTAQNYQTISGKVISSEDGAVLPGVNVVLKGSSEGTVTDANGAYQLNTLQANPRLVFSFIGLTTQEVTVDERAQVDIQMVADPQQLSEMVVTAVDVVPFVRMELAQPVGGREAFQKYLETNIQYPSEARVNKTEGGVTVQFVVKPDGRLQDFIVMKGIGDGCDEELIRLIKSGPQWTPTRRDKTPTEDKVTVRLRFSLPR